MDSEQGGRVSESTPLVGLIVDAIVGMLSWKRGRKANRIRVGRNAMTTATGANLTAYESDQITEIAAWKSEHPNPFGELFRRAAQPLADLVESVVPDRFALATIEAGYRGAMRSSRPADILNKAGVDRIAAIRDLPLETCDGLARGVGSAAQGLAAVEGAVTGAGGVFTTLLDVPIMYTLCVRTIIRTGYCYGYALDSPADRAWVLGAVAVALSSTNEKRVDRLIRLREMEDLLLEELQEQIVIEELASLLVQIEILADIPAFGAVSGALLNLSIARRIDETARRLFQERWLRDRGKVSEIAPAPLVGRMPAHHGWSGAWARAGYHAAYGIGFGLSFPVYLAGASLGLLDHAVEGSPQLGSGGVP